jgi:hypothetical protein
LAGNILSQRRLYNATHQYFFNLQRVYTSSAYRLPDNHGTQISRRNTRKRSLKFPYGGPARAGQRYFSLHNDILLGKCAR